MALARAGGYGHRIAKTGEGEYRVSWSYDTKYPDSKTRYVKRSSRYVDKAGAERFCKKWKIKMPEERT